MFFLSGSAALIYQVVWVRSLSLVFGGSHLAITTVLSVFMAGLAIGGYFIGRYTDRVRNQLRLYGLLEIGIAVFAVVFYLLNRAYPVIYRFLAGGHDGAYLYLTLIRIVFSVLVLIAPTVLMGGTLPVLTRFITRHHGSLRTHLSFLYGINTLGAVVGALSAGFYLLRLFSISTALITAITLNVAIGILSLLLQGKEGEIPVKKMEEPAPTMMKTQHVSTAEDIGSGTRLFSMKLVLLGAGVSGFCALGYEVLWTRILVVVTGASVYAFTTMLAAFLTGIALGSAAFGILPGIFRLRENGVTRSVVWFGIVQIIIGILALTATVFMGDLPENTVRVYNLLGSSGLEPPVVRIQANFMLAFAYMLFPTFFMGFAFPLAGKVHAAYRNRIGAAVGEVLSYNTVGAILGAAISGFLLISLFGIERSLQILIVVNLGFGLLVCVSVLGNKAWNWAVVTGMTGLILFMALNRTSLTIWNQDHFATFRNNQMEGYIDPEMVRAAAAVTDVLYYSEGREAIISVTSVGDGEQRLQVNGKVVASTSPMDIQVQFTLGHLPMLLHPRPEKVLVVGLGTGMTLGATSVHPNVREVTLVEIEPEVIDAARTFEEYNHHVLDNPRLKVVYNDGRNFQLTTDETFDVITADPIHPWTRGSSYLYTKEYYQLSLKHLSDKGIMCQWLPVYELTPADIRSVMNTFSSVFPEVMVWLTHYDFVLIGSRSPIRIDEDVLDRRINYPEVHSDLDQIMMSSSTDLLSHFVMGVGGVKRYSRGGVINTDDNLYLEFSAPFSVGMPVMEDNIRALFEYRESILPYLKPLALRTAERARRLRWDRLFQAAALTDVAHSMFLGNRYRNREFERITSLLDKDYSEFAPWRFLKNEIARSEAKTPVVVQRAEFSLMTPDKTVIPAAINVSKVQLSRGMFVVLFTDQDNKFLGQFVVKGSSLEYLTYEKIHRILQGIGEIYEENARSDSLRGMKYPDYKPTMGRIKKYLKDLSKEMQ
jgi:spermidine synthase